MFNSTITGNLVGNAEYAQIGAYDTAKFTIAVNQLATNAAPNITNSVVSVREPKFQYINGHSYKFDTSDGSNSGHPLRFYLDAAKSTAVLYSIIIM